MAKSCWLFLQKTFIVDVWEGSKYTLFSLWGCNIFQTKHVLTKTRNNVKPPETTWNHLKPTKNYLKPPETSHIIVFFTQNKLFSVWVCPNTPPSSLFWPIWSQKLKFSKFTKIWYRGTLLYCNFESNVYFFEILIIHIFWGKFGPSQNLKLSKLTKILYRGTFLYAYCDFNVYFLKIFVIHIFWSNLVPKSEVPQINWNLIQGYIATCLLRF